MNYKGFWMYYRAVIVSVIASLVDMGSMFTLIKMTKLNEELAVGLSSFFGYLFNFLDKNIGLLKIKQKITKN